MLCFFFLFFPIFVPYAYPLACGIPVHSPEIRPESLLQNTVWIAAMTENVRFLGILIRVRYPKVPYLNTKTWLYSTITYMYLWLIHIVVWQKSTQFCKAIISQLKINVKIKEWEDLPDGPLVKNLPVNIEGMSVIPGLGTKILNAMQCIWPKEKKKKRQLINISLEEKLLQT